MLELSAEERDTLAEALRAAWVRRHWVRLRAVWLAAEGRGVPEIAADLGVGASSIFAWLAQWRARPDPAALADAPKTGRPRALDAPLCAELAALLGLPPELYGYRTTGWTVAVLERHFAAELAAPVSGTTLRRTLHRLGYRWKRPRYVLARRDPERAGKKVDLARRVAEARVAGRRVRNAQPVRRHPALHAGAPEQRARVPRVPALAPRPVQALGPAARARPGLRPRRKGNAGALAAALRISFTWLPTACPELNPLEALWRDAKQRVSANRTHPNIDAHAADFVAHVVGYTDRDASRLSGVSSGNFWLTT